MWENFFKKMPSRFMKNAFYFMLKTILFLSWFFGHVGKRLDKKARVNFTACDVTDWASSHCNTHIDQYLKK